MPRIPELATNRRRWPLVPAGLVSHRHGFVSCPFYAECGNVGI
ncbi:hypothetical protein [Sphingomonas sp.]|nr:hypothetical protein [Sphingomonas sp.]